MEILSENKINVVKKYCSFSSQMMSQKTPKNQTYEATLLKLMFSKTKQTLTDTCAKYLCNHWKDF